MRNSLNAWRRALAILDAGETLIRDQIERQLLGWRYWPVARVLAATDKLCADIAAIRTPTIKEAFRLVRDAVGNEEIAGASLAAWASAFAKADAMAIRQAIESGIAEELDSQEIARKVVGSMIKKGVDGATEKLRFHTAWLSRSCPVVEDDGPKVMAAAQKILDDIMRDTVP
jgi:hypothetical protein